LYLEKEVGPIFLYLLIIVLGVGKSTTAAELAIKLSEKGKKVGYIYFL
jgi:Mrp family chromosome partitioning ATPase